MTGTFDNWSKTMQLDKVGDVFQKAVELPDASKKIYYKVRTFFPRIPSTAKPSLAFDSKSESERFSIPFNLCLGFLSLAKYIPSFSSILASQRYPPFRLTLLCG